MSLWTGLGRWVRKFFPSREAFPGSFSWACIPDINDKKIGRVGVLARQSAPVWGVKRTLQQNCGPVAHEPTTLPKQCKARWHGCPHLCIPRLFGPNIDGAVRTLHEMVNPGLLEGRMVLSMLINRRAVPALHKLENFGGAGLCARQDDGRPKTAAPPKKATEETFRNSNLWGVRRALRL